MRACRCMAWRRPSATLRWRLGGPYQCCPLYLPSSVPLSLMEIYFASHLPPPSLSFPPSPSLSLLPSPLLPSLSFPLPPSPSLPLFPPSFPSRQHLLQSRLVEVNPEASPQQLQDQVKVMTCGADYITLDMLRLRLLAPVRNSLIHV